MVRLALVGAGRWGRIYLKTIAAIVGVELVAVASTNPATAALVPPGCAVFADWRALLAAGGFDGLIVATPPATHAEIAAAALAHGTAVLVEKPLTLDRAEAEALRRAATDAGRHAQVGHVHLFAPAYRALKRLAAELGPVTAIRGQAGNHGPYRDDASVLWDWGPHDVAMMLDLMAAAPDSVQARVLDRRPVDGGIAERVAVALTFGTVCADIVLGTDMDKVRRLEVDCAGGRLVYDDLAADKLTRDGQPVAVAPDLPLTVALREFAAAVESGSNDISGLDLGIAVVAVLENCQSTLV